MTRSWAAASVSGSRQKFSRCTLFGARRPSLWRQPWSGGPLASRAPWHTPCFPFDPRESTFRGGRRMRRQREEAEAKDPMCGRRVVKTPASLTSHYKQKTYFFCSGDCQQAFAQKTERFRLRELLNAGAL